MKNPLVHKIENNSESQSHLDANENKFQGDCKIVFQLLYSGLRLSGRQLERDYDIDSRRLRDVIKARPDVVKKEWVKSPDGKTKYMEYYIDKFKAPTKSELAMWFQQYQMEGAPIRFIQKPLF